MGSSIVKNAFLHARHTYDGPNLNINRYGYTVWWQGKGGMKWRDLVPRLVFLSNFESPPSVLVIHCGGNSIGQTPLVDLRAEIMCSLKQIKVMFPQTKIVWSQILPRSNWRYGKNKKALNQAAERINNFAAHYATRWGCEYIKYPELAWDQTDFFTDDGVHLSNLGNDFFLYRLQMKLYDLIM